jgi:hypothetical protein
VDEFGFLIVARNQDGELIRGTTEDFRPDRYFFHVMDPRTGEPERVLRTQLKAVFFVKSLEGNPHHTERKKFGGVDRAPTKVWVEFTDGEELAGWTDEYDLDEPGFILFPTDPESNLRYAWIPHTATERVSLNEDALAAARAFKKKGPRRKRTITPQDWDSLLSVEPSDVRRADELHHRRVQNRLREFYRGKR